MEILNAFSTPMAVDILSGVDNNQLEIFCKEKSKDQDGQSLLLGWGSSPIKELAELVLKQVNQMHRDCGLKHEQKILHAWCNVNTPRKIATPHTHPCFFTSIYYVTEGPRLALINPNNNIENLIPDSLVNEYNPFNQLFQWIYPKPRLLITHPAWLLHYVEPEKDPNRVSLTFNTGLSR